VSCPPAVRGHAQLLTHMFTTSPMEDIDAKVQNVVISPLHDWGFT